MQEFNRDLFMELINNIRQNKDRYDKIDPGVFQQYGVKRGLRNSDGTGVLAGVTMVGHVYGYVVEDSEPVPIEGRLDYRGIGINSIIEGYKEDDRFGFEETSYLLLFGTLPTKDQLDMWRSLLAGSRALPDHFTEDMILKAPSPDIMNKLAACILSLYSYDENPEDMSIENQLRQSLQLIARFGTIISHAYMCKRQRYNGESLYLHYPRDEYSTAQNLLYCVRQDNKFTDEEAKLLDLMLVLHAEHGGGNNSAFSCRVLTSSGTDIYSAISAAVCSLKGPRHGGANKRVMDMFDDIKQNVRDWADEDEVRLYLGKIIRKEAGDKSGLVYGMGHAVYTKSDPRAIILRRYARELAAKSGLSEELKLMESVERLTPEVFEMLKGSTKTISANVDMYSGLVYKMLGISPDLYTPMFALARIVGWCAHRIEEVTTGGRIIRPAYKAIGSEREYVPLSERK